MTLTRIPASLVFCIALAFAATSAAEEKQLPREVARAKLVTWLLDNVRDEPQKTASVIVDGVAKYYGDDTDFDLTVNGTMTRSGKHFRLSGHAGQFIAIGLSKEQAEATGLLKQSLIIHPIAQQKGAIREVPPVADVSKLVIDQAGKMDAGKEVTGSVKIVADGNLPEGTVVRIVIPSLSKPYMELLELPVDWKPGITMLQFPRIDMDGKGVTDPDTPGDRVHVVFVDVCTIKKTNNGYTTNLLGNTVATIVVFE